MTALRPARGRGSALLLALVLWLPLSDGVTLGQPEPSFLADEGLPLTFLLVPVDRWDTAGGPLGHELSEGTVRLYRVGTYEPEIETPAGESVVIPPGDWVWVAEAPGFVSTFTNLLSVPPGRLQPDRRFAVPMTPACLIELPHDRRWRAVERLDVVSLDEAAVYPIQPSRRSRFWIPEGSHLAYTVRHGELVAISPIGFCRQHDTVALPVPEPPANGLQSLLVSARLPESFEPTAFEDLAAELVRPRSFSPVTPASPSARLLQGRNAVFFFLDVAAEEPFELSLRHPRLRSAAAPIEPAGGSAREIEVGELLERRDLEVTVDYRPARDHAQAEIELLPCGPQLAGLPPVLLHAYCGEPVRTLALEPGVHAYRFPALDDGQYLVDGVVDGEVVQGLGEAVAPYLAPQSTEEPRATGRLVEMHVHGRLLDDGEAVDGAVHLSPWSTDLQFPPRTFPTGEDREYHLYYFARYPTEGERTHLPDEIQDTPVEELPGLYCCFKLKACSESAACRTYNLHSTFTGEGRFDLDLPGHQVVDVQAIDATTHQPVTDGRLLIEASPAFHFIDGEVVWFEPLGVEPDSLFLDQQGRARWLPPEPGEHRMVVIAAKYSPAEAKVVVPPDGSVSVTLELEPLSARDGTQLLFDDGTPAGNGRLLAFGADGKAAPRCHARIDPEGFVTLPKGCSTHTFLIVHPWAALETFSGTRLQGSAAVRVRPRPPFPPRVRLRDPDGEPLRDTFVQLRFGDLTVTPNDLFAASTAGPPFQASNAVGEIVLNGVDPDLLFGVEVSPWQPYEESWVDLDSASNGVVEVTAALPR